MALGRLGWGRVSPNPMVGCVVVRGDEVVGEGWHAEYGGAHAEVVALQEAGPRARGAEVFVSLEPCRHEGKTPPCARALRRAGVSRVVFGATDPGTDSGGGARELADAGVEVVGPCLAEREARWENPAFFHRAPDRPWVALKLALSLDARIASRPGERTFLSGPEATEEVHHLRSGFDAILVGTRTALVDDPRLTARGAVRPRVPPRRILIDVTGRIEPEAAVFEGDGEVWILTTGAAPIAWRTRMEGAGARVIETQADRSGWLVPEVALRALRDLGITSLLCEGGGVLGSSLLRSGVVDRLYLVHAPVLLGEGGVPGFPGALQGRWRLGEPPRRLGEDLWTALEPDGPEAWDGLDGSDEPHGSDGFHGWNGPRGED